MINGTETNSKFFVLNVTLLRIFIDKIKLFIFKYK